VAPAIYSQLTFRQGRIFSARFTPDGETVVYGAAWEGSQTELFLARPGSPESRALGLQSAEILSISSTGEMAVLLDSRFTLGFMRSGTLARAPLAGGPPRAIVEDVEDADWSPSGDGLAVIRSTGGRYRLEYPAGKVLYETESWLGSVRFSRDGKRIAFLDHPNLGDNRGRVAVVDLDGKLEVLTEPFSSAGGLAWSPSGDEIWFTAGLTGNVQALHAVDLRGRQRIVDGAPANLGLQDVAATGRVLLTRDTWRRGIAGLAPGAAVERDLSWHDWSRPADLSADGEWLLFEEQGQGGGPGYSVYLRKTDGSPAVRLGSGSSMDLSPDGNWVLTLPVDRGDRLIVLPRGAGEARTLDQPGMKVFAAAWFPDGRRLLLLANEEKKLTTLYVKDSDDSKPRALSQEGMAYGFAISPDGALVAATSLTGPPWIYPVDGAEPRPLPGGRRGDVPVGWSEDGRSIFVAPETAKPARIDRIDVVTGERALWKEVAQADQAGLIDIGFVTLSADTRAYVYSYRQVLSTLYLVEGLR
jgi:Tol biopolymer transport system component